MTEQTPPPSTASDLIEVVFDGRSVSLLVRAPDGDQPAATEEDAVAALRRGPFASVPHVKLTGIVNAQSGEPVRVGEVPIPPDTTDWFVVTSPDALAAYLVPAPPAKPEIEVGGPEVKPEPVPISSEAIAEGLSDFGVTSGVLDDVVASFDPPRLLKTIECVARGVPTVEGSDATIEDGINEEHHGPVMREDGHVDHHATLVSRFVEEGAVIAMRVPPVEGTAGVDVSGKPLEPRPVTDRLLDGMVGQNTELQGDYLIASSPGRPVRSGDRIDVLPSYEVPGDLDYSVGNIEFDGDVSIRGDVKPGFSIVATGAVVIGGMVEHASIRAGGDLSVQGVIGTHDAESHGEDSAEPAELLDAGGDINAQYLHTIHVRAEGEIRVNREIVNCTVHGGRVQTSAGGRIVGGQVVAQLEIAAGSLGSHNGTRTQLQILTHRSEEPLVVRAWDHAYAGVRLNVSSAVLDLEDDLPAASFWQLQGEVVRLDAMATLPDVIAFAEETGRKPPAAPTPEEGKEPEDGEDDEDEAA